jgi:uncharacterized protein
MVLGSRADAPHSQRPAPIDAYKNRGFRFAGMSHRGSLLCFPDGIWAWSVNDVTELMEATLSAVFDRCAAVRTYNILLAENRRVGARLITVAESAR